VSGASPWEDVGVGSRLRMRHFLVLAQSEGVSHGAPVELEEQAMAQTRRSSVVWVDEVPREGRKEAGGASDGVVDLTVAGHTPKRRKRTEEECVIVREIKVRERNQKREGMGHVRMKEIVPWKEGSGKTREAQDRKSVGARKRRVRTRPKRERRSEETEAGMWADRDRARNMVQKRNRTRPPPPPPLNAVEIVDPATLKRTGTGARKKTNVTPETAKKCTVCLGEMEKMSSTTCGHVFCWDCIRRAVATQQKCPTCRKKLTTKQIHRIYL